MGVIIRPIKGLRRLQPCITHCHTSKMWRTPKTMLSHQTYVQQNLSQDHHQKDWDIHWLQSSYHERSHHVPSTIYVPNYGLCRDTRRWVDGPGINQSPVFTQRQLTKINRKISEPPTCQLHIWYSLWYILHPLCRWRITFYIQDQHRKRYHPPIQALFSVWPRNGHYHRKQSLKDWILILPASRFLQWANITAHWSHQLHPGPPEMKNW